MKNIFIIDTYPSTNEQKLLLKECITRLKHSSFDIMVVSHYPIPEDIQKMVNYVIYDDNNTFLPGTMAPYFWLDEPNFYFRFYNGGHTLPITRNIRSSLSILQSLGYDFFYFMEFDILFHEDDITKLIDLKHQMESEGKKLIMFEPENFYESGSHVFETLLFGGDLQYFLSKFEPPIDLDDWIKKNMGYTLELAFYEKLSQYSDDILIIPKHSYEIFSKSNVNVYRYGLLVADVVYNTNNPNTPSIIIYQTSISKQNYRIVIRHNDIVMYNDSPIPNIWWMNGVILDNSILTIDTYLDNELQQTKTYVLNEDVLPQLQRNGLIIYKTPES